jgi:hypothetical protein
MHPITIGALFALQCFHVLFLALHDWIPLGSLNDVKAVRMANPIHKLLGGTLISLTPFAIGLYASAIHLGGAYPSWLVWWLVSASEKRSRYRRCWSGPMIHQSPLARTQ